MKRRTKKALRRFILWRMSHEKSFSACLKMLPLFRALEKCFWYDRMDYRKIMPDCSNGYENSTLEISFHAKIPNFVYEMLQRLCLLFINSLHLLKIPFKPELQNSCQENLKKVMILKLQKCQDSFDNGSEKVLLYKARVIHLRQGRKQLNQTEEA